MNPFFDIHKDIPREGPGGHASMLNALSTMKDLPPHPTILDVGCGPGKQTIALAQETAGHITAIDTHQPFLERLERRAQEAGVIDQIRTVNMSMSALEFPEESFDLIWAEGAIYVMGFEQGFHAWRNLVRIGGYVAVTECSWLKPDPPDECRRFWNDGYPGMASVESNVQSIQEAGYDLAAHFVLPEADWWDEYYTPIEKRIALLREQCKDNPEAVALLNASQTEIDIRRKYPAWYGYVFYVARRSGRRSNVSFQNTHKISWETGTQHSLLSTRFQRRLANGMKNSFSLSTHHPTSVFC
jgi:SAM-dependent methyltransferase